MDHSKHARLAESNLNEVTLLDMPIYDIEDRKVGTVSHVHGKGHAVQVVVDVGGFLGIGAKPVALSADQLDFMRDSNGDVHAQTYWTKDQIKGLPEHHH
ncbi:PRC-barrel domain-containing protein [Albidovulum sp.]|uniref:PRC-barrel domain-containing protein n=1 Tax=Albidovulum sp. TaxID=1872424 RepID=UPI0039B8704F